MKIKKVHIARFRGFENEEFSLGSQLTAIAGQNGTQKSTLLGLITQTFTLKSTDPMRREVPLCGGSYISAFKDKFRLSPIFDKPKMHEWTISYDGGLPDFTVESIKRSGSDNIRFWKKGARSAGDGYLSFPTIFLSLKRLVPIAEEKRISIDSVDLSEDEVREFKSLHNKILISSLPIKEATTIKSTNKLSIGFSTDYYDWNQNSMGQDNLGKILLALFSFKRLKEKFPSYSGGILAIDELDATMYPASQVELLQVLRTYASKYNLQILFTTHSLSLLKAVDDMAQKAKLRPETNDQIKILYLRRFDEKIKISENVDIHKIFLNLNVEAETHSRSQTFKINTYTEDNENILFLKSIIKTKSRFLNFIKITLPCSTLIELARKEIPDFVFPKSIICLDGDVRTSKDYKKKIAQIKNILVLPGNESPERLLATYLNGLSDTDSLWNSLAEGYTKQVCFKDYSLDSIMSERVKAKDWFNSQLIYWGKGAKKVFNAYLAAHVDEKDKFIREFDELVADCICS